MHVNLIQLDEGLKRKVEPSSSKEVKLVKCVMTSETALELSLVLKQLLAFGLKWGHWLC